jgi:uncharacterized DUF497 family protein
MDVFKVISGKKFSWDDAKNISNLAKHGLDFPTAALVFFDRLNATREDSFLYEDRYQTIGMIGPVCILVVWTEQDDIADPLKPHTRIISARRAESSERRLYKNGTF